MKPKFKKNDVVYHCRDILLDENLPFDTHDMGLWIVIGLYPSKRTYGKYFYVMQEDINSHDIIVEGAIRDGICNTEKIGVL